MLLSQIRWGSASRSKSKGQALIFPLAWPGMGVGWYWRKGTLLGSTLLTWADPVSSSLAGLPWEARDEMSVVVIFCRRGKTWTTMNTGWLYLLVGQGPGADCQKERG